MGLTDAPVQVNLTDIYPEGTPFLVLRAWVEGVVKTQFGDRTMAKVVAQPVGAPPGSGQEFAVWGSLQEQVASVDPNELPMVVSVKKDGKRFLFVPSEISPEQALTPAPTQATDQEAALGVTPAPGEGEPVPAQAPAPAAAPPADPIQQQIAGTPPPAAPAPESAINAGGTQA